VTKEDFEERAAIKEFDGDMTREQAEREAACEAFGTLFGIELVAQNIQEVI